MNPFISACPVCGGEILVTKIDCPSCETLFHGSFQGFGPAGPPGAFQADQLAMMMPLASLTPEQLFFVLTFVRSEGRLNRMEEELGMSYPTLRSRFDEIVRVMGFHPSPGPATQSYE